MRSILLCAVLAVTLIPAARSQGAYRPLPPLSGSGATAVSVVTTAALIGGGFLLASADNNDSGAKPVGVALLSAGILFGPSTGNVVVGGGRDALIGTGMRAAGGAAAIGGTVACGFESSEGSCSFGSIALAVGGAALCATGIGYDLVTAPRNARRRRERRAAQVAVAPGYDVPTRSPALSLRVTF